MRLLITAPLLVLLVLFTLSNPQPARLALWPVDVTIEVPLAIAILATLVVGLLLGGLSVWFPALRYRLRARRAEERARRLEAKLERLQVQLASRLPPPGGPAPGS
jgi:uncharacterized integral membrane protein